MALTDSLKSVYLTAEESTGEHTIYCALRSSLEAVRIMSTYNNAPAWTLGQGVMCHGRRIKAGCVKKPQPAYAIRTDT